jgi:hypothetical protein
MRTGQPIIGRPAWYDRNPVHVTKSYVGSAVAPHSATSRWSYTVPSGKKAMVELLRGSAIRDAAANTVDEVWIYIQLIPGGQSAAYIIFTRLLTNNVGDKVEFSIGQSMILLPGDQIFAYTADSSTGGAVHYELTAKITEFDA